MVGAMLQRNRTWPSTKGLVSWKTCGPISIPLAIEMINVDEVRPERFTALIRNVPANEGVTKRGEERRRETKRGEERGCGVVRRGVAWRDVVW